MMPPILIIKFNPANAGFFIECGCVEDTRRHKEWQGIAPLPGLLPGFVSHVSHDLRSAASEANITEIFVVKQQYAQKRNADND